MTEASRKASCRDLSPSRSGAAAGCDLRGGRRADQTGEGADQPARLVEVQVLGGVRPLQPARTEFGRFGRQVLRGTPGASAAGDGVDLARMLTGTEGTLAVIMAATVRLVRLRPPGAGGRSDTRTWPPPPMRFRLCCRTGRWPWKVWTRASSTCCAAAAGGRRSRPAPRAGLAVRRTRRTTEAEAEAAARALAADSGALRARSSSGAPPPPSGGSERTARAWPAGHRPGPRPGPDGRTPPCPPNSWATTCGSSSPCWPSTTSTRPGLRALRGRLRARAHRLPARPPSATRMREFMLAAGALVARHGGSMSGEHGDGRARGELLALMYTPEAIALFRRRSRTCSTRPTG